MSDPNGARASRKRMLDILYVMEIGQNCLLQYERLGTASLKKIVFSRWVSVLDPVKCKEGFIQGFVFMVFWIMDYQKSHALMLCPCYLCSVKVSEIKSSVIHHILQQWKGLCWCTAHGKKFFFPLEEMWGKSHVFLVQSLVRKSVMELWSWMYTSAVSTVNRDEDAF